MNLLPLLCDGVLLTLATFMNRIIYLVYAGNIHERNNYLKERKEKKKIMDLQGGGYTHPLHHMESNNNYIAASRIYSLNYETLHR